jgi:ABC-2 type transport system ATP-binding protein
MLEARELTKHYGGTVALDALNLTVEPGEVFCLLGANGAGKTTTIHLFLNFLAPTSGNALVAGLDVMRQPREAKKYLAYIPEQVDLYPNLSALDNLAYFAALAGESDTSPRHLRDVLVQAGIPEGSVEERVCTYSKGMQQQIGIAIALAKDAKALLLDEPTSGMNPQDSRLFSEQVRQLADRGVAVLMATNDVSRAKEAGTRIGILRRGKLLATLRPDEVTSADLESQQLEFTRP